MVERGKKEPKDRTYRRDRAMARTFGVIGWELPGGRSRMSCKEK